MNDYYSIFKYYSKKSKLVFCALNFVRYIFEVLLRFINSCLFYFIPIDNKKILFRAYEGRGYTCNPKYISEFLAKDGYKIVWAFKKVEDFKYLEEKKYILVKYPSIKFLYHYMTAKVIVFNDLFLQYVNHRKNQLVINTWHGGGAYKKVGISLLNTKIEKLRYKQKHEATYYISSSKMFTNVSVESFGNQHSDYLNIGMPRNDIFFSDLNINEIKENIRNQYNIPKDMKVILYAPTYRKSEMNSTYGLDFTLVKERLNQRFGGKWIILFRGHYYLNDLNEFSLNNIVNVSEYSDMQHLLLLADVLITDYSSSAWDFSLQYKPCFLYVPDLQEYISDFDFYIKIQDWPYIMAESNEMLANSILGFNDKLYIEKIKRHHKLLGNYEKGHATNKIVNIIISHLEH